MDICLMNKFVDRINFTIYLSFFVKQKITQICKAEKNALKIPNLPKILQTKNNPKLK